jgi:EpsI family protein
MRQGQARFWIVLALLVGAAVFLRSRSRAESLPARRELPSFPTQIDGWTSRDVVISDDIRRILGNGDFLQRIYGRSPDEPPIDFLLAYFPTQRTGSSIHSPKNCLPGSGWEPIESSHTALQVPSGKSILVNRYILQRGSSKLLVLYWYQSQGRSVASEYWAKFYLVVDAIGRNRSDGALVRIITSMGRDEGPANAQQRAIEFTAHILPLLDTYVPR